MSRDKIFGCDNDRTVDQTKKKVSFWGLGCVSGNQYSQVVKHRFRLSKAVLDPTSYSKDEKNKIVKVNIIHRECDYLLCILKHDEIYQVSLNLMFDEGEKVIFFIEGRGKVYLSGYEVSDSVDAVPWDESIGLDLVEDTRVLSPRKSTPIRSAKSNFVTESKSDKKSKALSKAPSDETKVSPKPHLSMLFNGEMNDDDDDDEEDKDFSVGDEEESEESESEEEEEEEEDSELEEEVQVLGNEDEEDEIIEPAASLKRKHQLVSQQPMKRSRKESTSSAEEEVVLCEEISDSDHQNSCTEVASTSKNVQAADSSEKKKKKKKKKLNQMSGTPEQVSKSPKSEFDHKASSKKMRRGVEVHELIVGKGPEAVNGKMVHIFYVGRLQNKQIFDSRTPGKKPLSFKLGKNTVIKGLEIGLEGMKVGGKRRVIVPPNLGYGNAQVESVPPNSTLEFTVELQAVS